MIVTASSERWARESVMLFAEASVALPDVTDRSMRVNLQRNQIASASPRDPVSPLSTIGKVRCELTAK